MSDWEKTEFNAEIVVVNMDAQLQKRDGSVENGAEVVYKAPYQGVMQTKTKSIYADQLAKKPELKAKLATLKGGDKITVKCYRKAGGPSKLWNWGEIETGHHAQATYKAKAGGNTGGNPGDPNPAAIGQAINLAVDAGYSLDDLLDPQNALAIWSKLEAVKKVFNDVASGKIPKADAPQSPQSSYDDDIPF